ncbi:TOBE domain-containing protein [Thiocystis violacea]|uniref:TOBE domain-containing protein n=1 Tax=Thiocystis violacea TaxID=13725 RepID=UPI0019087CC1|nr:TOBE domain-containing protein [Thiocystis violacea]MBK1718702.1 molybdenum-dependent transcriptional regulator [Thiocystis violacea]
MPPDRTEPPKLLSRLSIDTALGSFLGDTRIRLLEAIAQHGSISRAAKAVPMSYKAAWDAVDAMNNLAETPLVESSVGGRHGGGTHLTAYGTRLIAMFRAVEQEYQGAMERLSRDADLSDAADLQHCRVLLRRMAMKTSTRNQFIATVSGLSHSQVSTEVRLRVDEGLELTALITRESAENLALAVGREVHAFIKASSVLLSTEPELRTSARNHLWGAIKRIHEGAVNADVTLSIPGGRTVTALVTRDSAASLGLEVGGAVCAVFKASSVILATLG